MPKESSKGGRNKKKCTRYAESKTFERNKARKLYKHVLRVKGIDTPAREALKKYAAYLPATKRANVQGIL